LERIAFVFFEGFWSYSDVVVDRTSLNVYRFRSCLRGKCEYDNRKTWVCVNFKRWKL